MRLVPLLLALLIATPAVAVETWPRFMLVDYIHAWSGTSRRTVVDYLSGIRDCLWWQCEYEVTIQQLLHGTNMQIKAARITMDDPALERVLSQTPFGDMVFLSLRNEPLYGKPAPCSK
ncbi:hypothetical protein U8C32_34395 (plasmid) [Sinorhizobium medicae]|uniref:hypothetical protein n=1 Tax=Sinorhizobium medicae TaxID=110321 RepID=UPI002AF6AC5A|nr:hypothetical protein [Sinorhizobium medicae]WQO49264.1 hypothetical protein U8C42_36090 [Sinorhizobium medicae]WQO69334.1 hypothetical protein U8C40_35115 [Sinorhizobium medicae]WQO76467.1 hypothetical protein U8C31_35415 [Sinorhizobium medicae]WQO95639.1 hypothetical protein U8C32_34395 [Sinorhizobium medicae]